MLGGANRSGTTLLSVILDSHPQLVVGPEIDFVEPVDLGPAVLAACELLRARDPRVLGPGTDTADPRWYHESHFVKQCERFGLSLHEVEDIVRQQMAVCGTDIVELDDRCRLIGAIGDHRRTVVGADGWGLKLQREIARVDRYARIWPCTRFVHIVRDGRDVAASHLRTVPWGFRSIEDAAEGWLEVVAPPHRLASPDRYREVRYEDLVLEPRRTLAAIVDFLGLAWHDDLLRHAELAHSLHERPWGHPAADAVSEPLHRGRVGRYRTDLHPDEIRSFERIAGAELTRLGYLDDRRRPC